MDLMSIIAVWALITLLLIFIAGLVALAAMFIYPGESEVSPPHADQEEPVSWSLMESEEARALAGPEYKRHYFEERDYSEAEEGRADED